MRRRLEAHASGGDETVTPVRRNSARRVASGPLSATPNQRNGPPLEDEKKQEIADVEHGRHSVDKSSHHQQHDDHPSLYLPRLPGTTKKRFKYKQSDSSLPDGSGDNLDALPVNNTSWRKRKRRRSSSTSSLCNCMQSTLSFPRSLPDFSDNAKLVVAVLLWYSLGVVSISTSKLLLTPYHATRDDNHEGIPSSRHLQYFQHVGGLPPLVLTIQQLLLGCTFFRILLSVHFLDSPGLHPMETILAMAKIFPKNGKKTATADKTAMLNHDDRDESTINEFQLLWHALTPSSTNSAVLATSDSSTTTLWYLLKAGICFSLGFYTTNLAFRTATSPAFVETVKAAEPITSATLAVAWGIDTMTPVEMTGLAGIIAGVLLSTSDSPRSHHNASTQTATALMMACGIIMTSNLCFSLRGLYQKLFRRATAPGSVTPAKSASGPLPPPSMHAQRETKEPNLTTQQQTQTPQLDDLNLQFRMQQTGVFLLAVPTLLWHGPSLLSHALRLAAVLSTRQFVAVMVKYFVLATMNGLAFSSYK
jgi:hypothetical protein